MVFQFKINIKNISEPPVWRRIHIPSQWSFNMLHGVIQAAFGWENYHQYLFSPRGWGSQPCIGTPGWEVSECQDANHTELRTHFTYINQHFTYIYDFGDNWIHHITLEKIIDENRINAELIDGKGKCPPEDCGGSYAYMDLKSILGNPDYPEYKEIREWLGMDTSDSWDPAEIDLNFLRQAVYQVR